MSGYSYMVTNEIGEPLGVETVYPDEPIDPDDFDTYDDDESDEPVEEWEEDHMNASEAYAEAEMCRWDDDPSPYDGNYSEE